MFISIDGIDGVGKSTQLELLSNWIQRKGREVLSVRDPGSTQLGEAIREILLHREEIPIASHSEMLLYMAARSQLVDEKIRPALSEGKVVLCDRFLLANVVYQGCGGGLDVEEIWRVGAIATRQMRPDITILLDLPVAVAKQRVGTAQDRLEKRGEAYFEKVRQGFLSQLHRASPIAFWIDASMERNAIHHQIVEKIGEIH